MSLADAVRYTPGLDAAGAGTRFGTEGLIVRGLGGNRVAMELDGMPLSQHFSVGNFSNATRDLVDIGVLDRIEVLRGPAPRCMGVRPSAGSFPCKRRIQATRAVGPIFLRNTGRKDAG